MLRLEVTSMNRELSQQSSVGTLKKVARWSAVLARDASFDGAFVYAVRSTGIYCRPSCPARRPERHQVEFFAWPEAAEHAGFRACRRCRPQTATHNPQVEMVRRVCRYIEANLDHPLTLAEMSAEVDLHEHHVQRTFKRITGITPRQYADARRLDRVKAELREGQAVTSAIYEAGYGSSSRLYERAASQLGMTPATYRKRGEGMHINYTIVNCSLGRLLVAATERGICAVSLGDSDAALATGLSSEYPAAEIQRGDDGLARWVQQLIAHLDGRQAALNLPLDVQATAFQWRVWEALRAIPRGETRSYGEVARAIGQPTGARAVARACATNPVALVIPCHRVVRENGELGGYRWHVKRKQALLERERNQ
jgi:AraC family transcriptional regulator of adaptative response/methylated-DNA-[protein]-cysteine methyltransferase